MNIEHFTGTSPTFLPEEFLVGQLEGWGVLESVLGDLQKRFTVKAQGKLDAATKIVDFTETWSFDDGFSHTLTWQIRKLADGRYAGEEARVKEAAAGEQAGCAFHWTYTRDTPAPSH